MGVGCEKNGVKVQGGSWKASNCNSKEKRIKMGGRCEKYGFKVVHAKA